MSINFELLDLRAFLTIIELGGFRKASEALHISQPALSRRVQALERAVGAPLLERTTRRIQITAAGRSIEPLARRLIGELEESVEAWSGSAKRRSAQITLACVPTAAFYFLPRAIERFTVGAPNTRFRILDLSANEALESVARGEAEFGINLTGSSHPELQFTPLISDPFILACRRDHPFAKKRSITWKDLQGQTLIGVSQHSGNRVLLDNALARSKVRLDFMYEVNHLTTSLGLVERGLAMSVLPKLATPPAGHPTIVTKLIGEPVVKRTIGIVERRAGRLSPAAQQFRDMLTQSLRH